MVVMDIVSGDYFFDLLEQYKDLPEIRVELERIIKENNINNTKKKYSLQLYDLMINWINNNLGDANTRSAGRLFFKKFFIKYFDGRNYDIGILTEVGDLLEGIVGESKFRYQMKYREGTLKIKTITAFNPVFQMGFIEEFLKQLSRFYFIREEISSCEVENELRLNYKVIYNS